jgi:Cu(I)/Ag(I) efflux system membrane fusion protein
VPDYSTRGVITEIDANGITLEHQPVPALKWPGMEMPFKLADRKLVRGFKTGQTVDFRFIQRGDDWVIVRITPAQPAAAAPATPAVTSKPATAPAAAVDPHAGHGDHSAHGAPAAAGTGASK